MMSWIESLLLPEFNLQVAEDLSLKPLRSQGLVQKIGQPPTRVQNTKRSKKLSRDNILTGRSHNQGTAEFSFAGRLTQTASFAVHFGEHAISKGMVSGMGSSCGCGLWPHSRQGCRYGQVEQFIGFSTG